MPKEQCAERKKKDAQFTLQNKQRDAIACSNVKCPWCVMKHIDSSIGMCGFVACCPGWNK